MDEIKDVSIKTNEKIKELQEMSLKGHGSLMSVIRSNIKNWEKNLKPVCGNVGKSYIKSIAEILESSGYEVDRKKLTVYLNRVKKGE